MSTSTSHRRPPTSEIAMPTPLADKSTTNQIRQRFDNDVERFSQLQTGQRATINAPLAMELITSAAVASTNPIQRLLDIGCGAGNNTLKLRQVLGSDFDIDLVDLSQPMLDRATERLQQVNNGAITVYSEDFRSAELPTASFDVILAAAVLHHLRDETDWQVAFENIYQLLKPGGSV
jgi:tRNA (cmo5U34)-methyltransferase